jgi:hypothetical protein
MRLPEKLRDQWLDLARRMREVPNEQFFDGERYHPIRKELGELAWQVEPVDIKAAMLIYDLVPELIPTIDWAESRSVEDVQAMLLAIISKERWVQGVANPAHANGFISYALERVAFADGTFNIKQ